MLVVFCGVLFRRPCAILNTHTHTHTHTPLFDERAASSSSRFFSSSSSSLPIARHARERHHHATVFDDSDQKMDEHGSPFLLFCLGFVIFRVFPKSGPFFIHFYKKVGVGLLHSKNALCLLVCITASDTRGGRKEGTCAPAAASSSQ